MFLVRNWFRFRPAIWKIVDLSRAKFEILHFQMRLSQKVLEITQTCKHVFGRIFEVHYHYVKFLKIRWKTKKWRALKNFYEKSTQLWRTIFPTPGDLEGTKSGVELNIMSLMHVPNFIEIGPLVNKWPNYFHKFCDLSHCATWSININGFI